MERKRTYDRERMERLYREGQTWWQRRGRNDYDRLRSMFVRPLERYAAGALRDGDLDFIDEYVSDR